MITDTPNSEATQSIFSESFSAERKNFFLDLHENHRGQFVRITEDANGRRDRVMVPSNALREMVAALDRIIAFAEKHYTPSDSSF